MSIPVVTAGKPGIGTVASVRPILSAKSCDFPEFTKVPRKQGKISAKHRGGDPKVHGPDADTARPKRVEPGKCSLVEREHLHSRKIVKDALEHAVGMKNPVIRPPSLQVSVPTQRLLMETDDADEEAVRSSLLDPGDERRSRLALNDGDMIRVEKEHARSVRLLSRTRAVRLPQLFAESDDFVEVGIILERAGHLVEPATIRITFTQSLVEYLCGEIFDGFTFSIRELLQTPQVVLVDLKIHAGSLPR